MIKVHESGPKHGHGEWGHVFLQFFFFSKRGHHLYYPVCFSGSIYTVYIRFLKKQPDT